MSAPTKKIAEAWRTIDNTFVDRTFNNKDWFKIREDALSSSLKYKTIDEAYDQINQMTSLLGDKYTRLLRPTEYKTLVDAATSKSVVAGVGIEIGKPTPTSNSRPTINDLEQNAPAFKSGLKKGDVFSSINSVSIPPCDESNFCMTSLASNLRGDVNTDVTVEIIRGSGDKQQSQSFTLTRQQFAVTTVRSYISKSDSSVGVVRIKSFSTTTQDIVTDQINELKKKGAKNILFDLRGNPGGSLQGGVDTASLFLHINDDTVNVYNNKGGVDRQRAYVDGFDLDIPVAILVDENTASAAEVMTAALQDNKRAVVISASNTFGKGIIQTIRPLSGDNEADNNGGGLAVTIAKYQTPNHTDINKKGIAPDVKLTDKCLDDDAGLCLPPNFFNLSR
ncbi:hypothetical protein ScalyP_jg2550 [Parmales sp. scaly parma]|nr:hypothetical protein ScalyP_jg2550 [Parmales sp. scaly parma]